MSVWRLSIFVRLNSLGVKPSTWLGHGPGSFLQVKQPTPSVINTLPLLFNCGGPILVSNAHSITFSGVPFLVSTNRDLFNRPDLQLPMNHYRVGSPSELLMSLNLFVQSNAFSLQCSNVPRGCGLRRRKLTSNKSVLGGISLICLQNACPYYSRGVVQGHAEDYHILWICPVPGNGNHQDNYEFNGGSQAWFPTNCPVTLVVW